MSGSETVYPPFLPPVSEVFVKALILAEQEVLQKLVWITSWLPWIVRRLKANPSSRQRDHLAL